jgi:hypothetical protein
VWLYCNRLEEKNSGKIKILIKGEAKARFFKGII